ASAISSVNGSLLEPQLSVIDCLRVTGSGERLQIVDPRAEQSHRAPAGIRPFEQSDRAPDDVIRIARRLVRMAARDRGEVAIADLDRHRAGEDPLAAEPESVVARHPGELLADALEIRQVLRVRALRRRRFGWAVRLHGTVILAEGEPLKPFHHAADGGAQDLGIGSPYVDEPVDAPRAQPLRGHRADTPEGVHG